jgi:hypothetical protein
VISRLHLDLEAEFFRRLLADVYDRRIRAADMIELDLLDILRPDRRESGN